MHQIEPYYGWHAHYDSSHDEQSPFYGKEYNYDLYSEHIYGYFIDPGWDFFGSETLYLKILYADYQEGFAISEIDGIRVSNEHGWWLLRASNTQNVLVTRVEANSLEALEELKNMVSTEVQKIGYGVSFPK